MTHNEMMNALISASDPGYGAYQRKIICDSAYPMLCVRMPVLRKIAKDAVDDWVYLAENCTFSCYEEIMAICLAVACGDAPLAKRLSVLKPLVERLDSWGLTDSIVPTLAVKPGERRIAWDFAVECIRSEREYVRRFGIVMLLHFFLVSEYLDAVEEVLLSVGDNRYYVRMACAWLLSEMAVVDWQRVKVLLTDGIPDRFVHNMTIRKIRESLRISTAVKAEAAALRRKEEKYV